MMFSIEVEGMDGAEKLLDNLRRNAERKLGQVLGDTARNVGVRFSKTAPIGRTGQLFRSARFRRTPFGGGVRLAVRHGKPAEALTPTFNNAIKASMKGIRGRIRQAMREAADG